jgi:hypothetical protein
MSLRILKKPRTLMVIRLVKKVRFRIRVFMDSAVAYFSK